MSFFNLIVNPRAKCKLALKADAIAQALDNATPAQISNWVDNNIIGFDTAQDRATTLTALRRVVKFLLISEKSK